MGKMMRRLLAAALCLALLGSGEISAAAQETAESAAVQEMPDPAAAQEASEDVWTAQGEPASEERIGELEDTITELQENDAIVENQLLVVTKKEKAVQDIAGEEPADQVVEVTELDQKAVVTVETDADSPAELAARMAEYEADPEVLYVQPNYVYYLLDQPAGAVEPVTASEAAGTRLVPSDTYVANQWYLGGSVRISDAWNYVKTQKKIKVAVIDTGVQGTHPDLKANISSRSYDFANNTGTMTDSNGHGTHVAGIIAAAANNSTGIAGVSFNAELLCYNVFSMNGNKEEAQTDLLVAAYSQAVNDGARVINMSLGSYERIDALDITLRGLIDSAYQKNILTVGAGGNENRTAMSYPADFDACISVTSTNSSNVRSYFSDYNQYKDIAAPGENIYSTWKNSSYSSLTGTSMAAPIVSGVIALMLTANPNLTADQVKQILYANATDLGAKGWDNQYGHGLVNAYEAVQQVLKDQNKLTEPTSVRYSTHIQDIGWQAQKKDGEISGTTGQKKRMESIRISLANLEATGGVQYKTHVQNKGWLGWSANGANSGSTGQSLRLEAIRIRLTGNIASRYDIYYRVHAQEFGWMGWAKNGEAAGSAGYAYRLEALQIQLVAKGGSAPGSSSGSYRAKQLTGYQTHIQNVGWQGWRYDGAASGTTGQSRRLEGIKLDLISPAYDGVIQYQTHIQDIGWQGWKQQGALSGTTGQSRHLEAIQIRLTGEMAEQYDVWYRVHAENFGWMGWTKNGGSAGSAGYAYRLEALQIQLTARGGAAPGSTATPFRSRW